MTCGGAALSASTALIWVNAPRGSRVTLTLATPDGGVAWHIDEPRWDPKDGGEVAYLVKLEPPSPGVYRLIGSVGDAGACAAATNVTAHLEFLSAAVDGKGRTCRAEMAVVVGGGAGTALQDLNLGRTPVGDFPPYEAPWVHAPTP